VEIVTVILKIIKSWANGKINYSFLDTSKSCDHKENCQIWATLESGTSGVPSNWDLLSGTEATGALNRCKHVSDKSCDELLEGECELVWEWHTFMGLSIKFLKARIQQRLPSDLIEGQIAIVEHTGSPFSNKGLLSIGKGLCLSTALKTFLAPCSLRRKQRTRDRVPRKFI
jgi:hypothetical protein